MIDVKIQKTDTMKRLIIGTLIFLTGLISCERETELTFEDFDKNNNDLINQEEFQDVFTSNFYDDWNITDDAYLDDEDFYTAVYRVWDVDDDELLSEEEWMLGYDHHYGDYIAENYEVLDVDNDGYLEYVEYQNALADSDFFLSWDVDENENIDEEELAKGVFERWDLDNSGYLERDEYTGFDTYYLDI